jgi:uncharacterized damage-inducible protein DinB
VGHEQSGLFRRRHGTRKAIDQS